MHGSCCLAASARTTLRREPHRGFIENRSPSNPAWLAERRYERPDRRCRSHTSYRPNSIDRRAIAKKAVEAASPFPCRADQTPSPQNAAAITNRRQRLIRAQTYTAAGWLRTAASSFGGRRWRGAARPTPLPDDDYAHKEPYEAKAKPDPVRAEGNVGEHRPDTENQESRRNSERPDRFTATGYHLTLFEAEEKALEKRRDPESEPDYA